MCSNVSVFSSGESFTVKDLLLEIQQREQRGKRRQELDTRLGQWHDDFAERQKSRASQQNGEENDAVTKRRLRLNLAKKLKDKHNSGLGAAALAGKGVGGVRLLQLLLPRRFSPCSPREMKNK